MRLIPVNYCGFTAMDRRFSSPMLPWIVSEIRKRDSSEKLSLGVEEAALQAYNSDFEIQFTHKLCMMTRFSQADLDPCTFLYLLRDDTEQLLYCYLFNATKPTDVTDLYQQMKEQSSNAAAAPTRSLSSAANLTSLCVDISPSSSNFFEVLYIGKIKVWNKKVPDSFIDDALEKFKLHDLEKARRKAEKLRHDYLRRGSVDSTASDTSSNRGTSPLSTLQRSQSVITNLGVKSPEIDRKVLKSIKSCDGDSDSKENSPAPRDLDKKSASPNGSTSSLSSEKSEHQDATRQLKLTPAEIDDHNRTMVLQVDRTDLRLISPDRKVILLHKHHKDVTTCIQGQIYSDHFGFIAKENGNVNTYIGFVFKCESTSVAAEAVGAITQAFNNADTRNRPMVTSCDHCPMVWFHKLCCEVEHLTDKKTQVVIFKRIEQLDEEEQMVVLTKFRGAETDSVREQNEFLMMLLRAHCEMKQGRHMHDTAENRSEFLNQYLGGGNTIFMKAKRSLTTSFDNLLKRKASKDDLGPILKDMTLPINPVHKESSPSANNESDSEGSKSSMVGSQSDLRENHLVVKEANGKTCEKNANDKTPKSPMLDIFLKVGSSPKSTVEECSPNKQDVGSWRQAIFKRVVTPNKAAMNGRRRSREELRTLWKKSIHQAVLLIRMEKENARLRARQEETAVKRIKLEYDEMKSVGGAAMEVWELLTNKDPSKIKCDNKMLLHAIKQGIPRGKRGEVWSLLAEQFCARKPPIDTTMFPSFNVPYETLLKQLTSHQHAILIDLGRTFPCHSYFSSPLGPGQLALFNLLKAYSLLDPDVGYCQGLSFVAGVLLLHMEESQAFFLLRHLMFRRGLRKQYLPDMVGLQVRLYQLSRLLHDQLPELYNHFDLYEVAPTLYAAPWLLTIFASQFPLGFVTRVFDLIFLENTEVVFRVAIALLSHHKDQLLACDSFEEIMNYLKTKLPEIDKVVLEKIMKQVYTTDISKQLNEYKVEYQVLQEEMQSVQPQVENVHKLETANKSLTSQNKMLMSQLESALSNVQRLEATRAVQQSTINQLKTQNRCLDVTIATLASFINGLIEDKLDVEIPGEVRRVMSQISFSERRETKNNFLNNMFKKTENVINPNKIMVKSLSTGRIGIPNIDENQVLRTNSLNAGGFFSKSHNHILQQQKLGSYPAINTLEVKIEDVEEEEKQRKKASTLQPCLPLIETIAEYENKTSPTNSVDSGVDTPSSPKDTNIQASEPHPLSNCDVTFTFNGTRELKKVRNLRHMTRTSSPDLLSK